jgi:hypothetical protein
MGVALLLHIDGLMGKNHSHAAQTFTEHGQLPMDNNITSSPVQASLALSVVAGGSSSACIGPTKQLQGRQGCVPCLAGLQEGSWETPPVM